MPTVFVNYRTGDEEDFAAMLERELSGRFEPEVFFRAAKSIPYGDDFEEALVDTVRRSDALLAVIGPRWLEARRDGRRRIDDEDDWVRRELLEAFRHGVRVIPVLIGSARPPAAEELPTELAGLARLQYARLGQRSIDADLDRLAAELTKVVPGLRDRAVDPGQGTGGGSEGVRVDNRAAGNARVGLMGGVFNGDITLGDGRFDGDTGRGDRR